MAWEVVPRDYLNPFFIWRVLRGEYTPPDFELASVLGIDGKKLKKKGAKVIFFDADNTLFAHGAREADERVIKKLKQLQEGFELGIITNTYNPKRRGFLHKYFNKSQGLKMYVCASKVKKPGETPFKDALRKFKYKPSQCVMVGDNLFTDVVGGKRVGMLTIKVKPYSLESEPVHLRLMRFWGNLVFGLTGFFR